jgi:hypothetical protein
MDEAEKEAQDKIAQELDSTFETRWLPLMAGIGRIATTWAKLEFMINEMIWDLSNVDVRSGACITAQIMSPIGLMRALIALVRLHGGKDDLISDLNKLSGRIDGVARRRNRIVHDPWGWDATTKTYIRLEITADRKLVFEDKAAELADLKSVFDDICALLADFWKMEHRIMAELPAWPRIQYWQSWEKHRFEMKPDPGSEPKAPPSPPQPSPESPSYKAQLIYRRALWFWASQT